MTPVAAVAVAVSTAAAVASSGTAVASRDRAVRALAPAGYAQTAAAGESDIELADPAGDRLSLRQLNDVDDQEGLALGYEELKALEGRLGAAGDCDSLPPSTVALDASRRAVAVEGRCGAGPGARDYGVLLSTAAGVTRLVAAQGPLAPALAFLASASGGERSDVFPVLAQGPLPPLAPLPPRPFHGKIPLTLLAGFALLQAAALPLRAMQVRLKGRAAPAEAPPAPGSAFPLRIERRPLRSEIRFDVVTAAGAELTASSDRKASVVLAWGAALLALFGLQAALGAGRAVLAETLAVSLASLFGGALLQRASPRKIRVVDSENRAQLWVAEDGFSLLTPHGSAFDPDGWELARLTKKRAGGLRRWELREPQRDDLLLEIVERPSRAARLRPVLGHLWGLLRSDYALVREGREVGSLRRDQAIRNKLRLDLQAVQGLDPRVVLGAALFIERVDPDRWHPWFA